MIFTVWFDVLKELERQNASRLGGTVVIDQSNPVALGEDGQMSRTLQDGVPVGWVIASLLPPMRISPRPSRR